MSNDHLTTRIIVARHGEATYPTAPDKAASGGTLTALGQDQARGLGYALRDEHVAAVVCSALSRAEQTAAIAAEILGLPVDVRDGLHEYQQGDDPHSIEAIGMVLLGWLAGDLHARVLGGESGAEIAQRVLPVLEDLVRLRPGETVLVVMHGGAILATLGSIAPGRTGLPSGNNPDNLAGDLVAGSHFCLEHRSGSRRIVPPARHD